MPAKLVPTFADRGRRVVIRTDPHCFRLSRPELRRNTKRTPKSDLKTCMTSVYYLLCERQAITIGVCVRVRVRLRVRVCVCRATKTGGNVSRSSSGPQSYVTVTVGNMEEADLL
jgi:hypothetical protein